MKSEMKMARDRDREVKFKNNSREFSRNETLAGYWGKALCIFIFGVYVFVFVYKDVCIFVFAYQRGFQRGIPDVKVRGSRSGLAGTRGLQASHLAKKTINNGASGALVHQSSGALVHRCIRRRPVLHVAPTCRLCIAFISPLFCIYPMFCISPLFVG
jgi:hypothetical protein